MRRLTFLTPAEKRLAGLLFVLSIIGLGTRLGERISPEVRQWLDAEAPVAGAVSAASPASPGKGSVQAHGISSEIRAEAAANSVDAPSSHPVAETYEPVDPNTAGVQELMRLDGVGPVLAARIVGDRQMNGRFHAPEDLLRVKGIGPATLDRVRTQLKFSKK